MLKKIIKFLDRHRFILIILILFFISLVFLGIKSYLFLNYNFIALKCTENIDNRVCYNESREIYKEPNKVKKEVLNNRSKEIIALRKKYDLPKLNDYTSYFYQVVALLDYNMTGENEELYTFFKIYNNTYNLEEFYIQNNIFYKIFYNYQIPINVD